MGSLESEASLDWKKKQESGSHILKIIYMLSHLAHLSALYDLQNLYVFVLATIQIIQAF